LLFFCGSCSGTEVSEQLHFKKVVIFSHFSIRKRLKMQSFTVTYFTRKQVYPVLPVQPANSGTSAIKAVSGIKTPPTYAINDIKTSSIAHYLHYSNRQLFHNFSL